MSSKSAIALQNRRKDAKLCIQCGDDSPDALRCKKCRLKLMKRVYRQLDETGACQCCMKPNDRARDMRKKIGSLALRITNLEKLAGQSKTILERTSRLASLESAKDDLQRLVMPIYCTACLLVQKTKRDRKAGRV